MKIQVYHGIVALILAGCNVGNLREDKQKQNGNSDSEAADGSKTYTVTLESQEILRYGGHSCYVFAESVSGDINSKIVVEKILSLSK